MARPFFYMITIQSSDSTGSHTTVNTYSNMIDVPDGATEKEAFDRIAAHMTERVGHTSWSVLHYRLVPNEISGG